MQDLVDGDNKRTPVIFQGSDIYRFVGDSADFESPNYRAIKSVKAGFNPLPLLCCALYYDKQYSLHPLSC